MKVIGKKPGKDAEVMMIDNDLRALQEYVGGHIETFTFSQGACVICNEEGRLNGMPYNLTFVGQEFYGPVLIAGVKKDDFCDVPAPGFILHEINKGVKKHD